LKTYIHKQGRKELEKRRTCQNLTRYGDNRHCNYDTVFQLAQY